MDILEKEYLEHKYRNDARREQIAIKNKRIVALEYILKNTKILTLDNVKLYFYDDNILFEYENSKDGRFVSINEYNLANIISNKVDKLPLKYGNIFRKYPDTSLANIIRDGIINYLDIYDFTVLPLMDDYKLENIKTNKNEQYKNQHIR